MRKEWKGKAGKDAIAYCKRIYGFTCWLCHHEIEPDDYTVDHVIEQSIRPDLAFVPGNWRPAHGKKHPEFGCPGNFGRSKRKRSMSPNQTADGW